MKRQRTLGRVLFAMAIALAVTTDDVGTRRGKEKAKCVKKNKNTQQDVIVIVMEA